MRAIVQRVENCKVKVEDRIVGSINKGLLVYLGVSRDDTDIDLNYILSKVLGLRIFEDNQKKMNLSVEEIEGELMVISQFTLYGDARKGKRPSFTQAAGAEMGKKMYIEFCNSAKAKNIPTQMGEFGAHMKVEYTNDGPVTIMLDSTKKF